MAYLTTKEKQKAQGYDARPPAPHRCHNCKHFRGADYGQPPIEPGAPGLPSKPALCTLGSFICEPRGLCREWQSSKA